MDAQGLAAFQQDFAAALLDPERDMPRAFAVYGNTVMKGCIDALQANFPSVDRLVGEEWFRAAAAVFVRAHSPRLPMLLEYGHEFPGFLAAFEPAGEFPYLAAVARLDRFWTEAHVARDEAVLDARSLAGFDPDRLGGLRLRPHASARWAWFDVPAYTIWSRQRGRESGGDVTWQGEGALVARPGDAVHWIALDQAHCAFLDACTQGQTLAEAAEAAVGALPGADLAALMRRLLEAGAFANEEWT
jgi:Putative DNA-binding domain